MKVKLILKYHGKLAEILPFFSRMGEGTAVFIAVKENTFFKITGS